jgi:isopentenyl diphosphate isomerase/L-lactate dehydrogenase-like FMN-dependent dehydrogenase
MTSKTTLPHTSNVIVAYSASKFVPDQAQNTAEKTNNIHPVYNVDDYQKISKAKISKALYEYLASGTDDEQTLAENRSAWKMWYLRPRVLKPMSRLSTATTLFGQRLDLPVFTSPAGVQALADPEHGECATARAAGRMGTMFGLSQHATRSIEQVAEAAPDTNKWFQSYILKDREMTLRLVRRAVKAGYKGIFLTVDSMRFGYREADARNGWDSLPAPHRLVNYDDEQQKSELSATYNGKEKQSWDQNSEMMFEQNVSWNDIRWLKENACQGLPLVIKGIMTGEDAAMAVEAGADGVMVSNHGGRALDGCVSAIDALPEVAKAVNGRIPILLDSGVRRGTDVLKALALGATAVGIGKPLFFALSVGGEDAVVNVLTMLKTELEAAMAICGVETVKDITPGLISRHPSGGPAVPYIRSAL